MSLRRLSVLAAVGALVTAGATTHAQRPGGMAAGDGCMMGARHDSATMAQMSVIHQLVMAHDRITRTVTNLPDGIRTVTESDDPAIARLIRAHVMTLEERVAAKDDPGLPMESPALRLLYRNGDRIRMATELTPKGVVLVQTSRDSATVAALQQHAREVTALVRGGMTAMHEAMVTNSGGAMPCGMGGPPAPRPAAPRPPTPPR